MKWYTGIGSRKTPANVLREMEDISLTCYRLGWHLRSGGAKGADKAFESNAADRCVSYRPTDQMPQEAYDIARKFYEPYSKREFGRSWSSTKAITKGLMTRNVYQVLGDDLNTPSQFVICWTPDGCESSETRTKATGGTGQAIAVATAFQVEVINLYNPDAIDRLEKMIRP